MSEPVLISEDYMFIIETDSFAGHFAEDLCAYCTGYIGENGKGREFSDLYYMEMGISDDDETGELADEKNHFYGYIGDRQTEEGYWEPFALWPSKKYGCNTQGQYSVRTESQTFYDDYPFPALFGICIYFNEMPQKEHMETIKERAVKFFEQVYPKVAKEGRNKNVKIEDFRLVCHKKYAEELVI